MSAHSVQAAVACSESLRLVDEVDIQVAGAYKALLGDRPQAARTHLEDARRLLDKAIAACGTAGT